VSNITRVTKWMNEKTELN